MQPIDEGDANRLMSLIDAALASGSPVTEIAMDHDGTPCRLVLASGVGISWVRGLLGEPATEPKPEPQLLGNPLELPEEARGPSNGDVYPQFCDSCSDSIYDDEGELIRNPRVEQLRKRQDEAKRTLRLEVAVTEGCGLVEAAAEAVETIRKLRKERDEALARAEKAEAALSTPPQPNHASNDQPIRWFLCQYGDPYDDGSDTDRGAAIATSCGPPIATSGVSWLLALVLSLMCLTSSSALKSSLSLYWVSGFSLW